MPIKVDPNRIGALQSRSPKPFAPKLRNSQFGPNGSIRKFLAHALQQVLCKLWFHYFLSSSKSWKVVIQKLCLLNLMKQKVLAKQTGSFKIKFDKNVILKYICHSIFCLLFWRCLLNFFNVLRYTAYYMTVSQSINLNW